MVQMRHPIFRSSAQLFVLATLVSLALLVNGFTAPITITPTTTTIVAPKQRQIIHSSSFLSAASTADDEKNDFRTLYDILGASPKDSYQTLRRKYKTLARQMHPDANNNNNKQLDVVEFTQVVAAWRVLADPKERLKYDRSLKAKEFTNSMEKWIDLSIQTAIPFMKKTANTTMLAVETSSKTMEKVGKRMGVAMDLLELERKSLALEQQATREAQQAQRLKEDLANIDKKRMDKLSDPNVKLSSAEALRILESFDLLDASRMEQVKEIQSLQQVENMYKERVQDKQETQRQIQRADASVETAVQREVLAQQKLAEAQREVLEAKLNLDDCLKLQKAATTNEKMALKEMEKMALTLDTNAAKVRMSLKKREAESLQRESVFLREESARLEQAAEKLRQQAEKIKAKANAIKKKQDEKRKQQGKEM